MQTTLAAPLSATGGHPALGQNPMAAPERVPPCRDELRLLPASHNRDGSPAWMILDPIVNRFYRIDWLDFEILSRWQLREVTQIVADVNAQTTLEIEPEDVNNLAAFLQRHHLLQVRSPQDVGRLVNQKQALSQSWLTWLEIGRAHV